MADQNRPPVSRSSTKGTDPKSLKSKFKLLSGSGEKNPKPSRKKPADSRLRRIIRWPIQDSPVQRWTLVTILAAILALLLFPAILREIPHYEIGDIALRDIKASRTYLVEDRVSTEERRGEAAEAVPTVYDFDDWMVEGVLTRVRQSFGLARDRARDWGGKVKSPDGPVKPWPVEVRREKEAALKSEFESVFGTEVSEKQWALCKKVEFQSELEEGFVRVLSAALWPEIVQNRERLLENRGKGIILRRISNSKEFLTKDLFTYQSLSTVHQSIKTLGQTLDLNPRHLRRQLARMITELSSAVVRPNLIPNLHETKKRRDEARKKVKPVFQKVQRGEMLVREGEVISPPILARLKRESEFRPHEQIWVRVGGMFLLLVVLLRCLYQPSLFRGSQVRVQGKDLLFVCVTVLLVFGLTRLALPILTELARGWPFIESQSLYPILPVAAGAMLVCVFLGLEAAFLSGLVLAFLASQLTDFKLESFALFLTVSLVGARSIRNRTHRGATIKAGLMAGLVGAVMAISARLIAADVLTPMTLIEAGAGLAGGLLAGIIVSGLIPLVEMAFGYTTDMKLLELANLDQPYLKEFLFLAPGSYHHSVIVGNMVETAAEAIGANPLLAKVAAYYHDIGKIKKPQYFIENQQGGENRHEKLAPSMSALILIAHVKDGVEIARQAKLGRKIRDIIAQHHGTTLITYFYDKAVKIKGDKEEVNDEDFRYPGPKPQTREAGLVMLADQVEAACKSLTDPAPSRIQGLVQKIINRAFVDGQLSDCELTLKDLHAIAASFNKVLNGLFHQRIAYPELSVKQGAKKADGDTATKRANQNGSGSDQDRDQDQDTLRRLGIS